MTTTRRAALSTAAWSLPVIAVAVAAPAVVASNITPTPAPLSCTKIQHSAKGGHQWVGIYTDGSTVTMTNGDAMSSVFGPMCRAAGENAGAGK